MSALIIWLMDADIGTLETHGQGIQYDLLSFLPYFTKTLGIYRPASPCHYSLYPHIP